MALDKNLFQTWIEGQAFSARDYVYERDLVVDYVNTLVAVDDLTAGLLDDRYYTETELDAGQLDDK